MIMTREPLDRTSSQTNKFANTGRYENLANIGVFVFRVTFQSLVFLLMFYNLLTTWRQLNNYNRPTKPLIEN